MVQHAEEWSFPTAAAIVHLLSAIQKPFLAGPASSGEKAWGQRMWIP